MSYISDWLASDGGEEAYTEYRYAAAREEARERAYIDDFERYADDDLVIENEDGDDWGYNPYQE